MNTDPVRVAALRKHLSTHGLAGFVVPLTDEHMSEYVGAYAQRLQWLTGFEGSAGNAVVMTEGPAAIFIDGRYTIQVGDEVDSNVFEHYLLTERPLVDWLRDHCDAGDQIGYDPELAVQEWVSNTAAALKSKGATLKAVLDNPIDAVWTDQPEPPMAPVSVQPDTYSGSSAPEKRAIIAAELAEKGADAAIVSMLDSVAWAFNIRGKDVKNTPVPHAYAILKADETAQLFVESAKLTDDVRTHLGNAVEVMPRDNFYDELRQLAGKTVMVDPNTNNARIIDTLKTAGADLTMGQDPCIIRKACKNPVELQGSRDAHIRDGAAVSEFLCWFSQEAPNGKLTEIIAAETLWQFREKRAKLHGSSFDTISGAGPNGAMCHYRVNEKTNRTINVGDVFLIDSGGQYDDGTTDITRTMAVGDVGAEACERYTLVLKGHIALATTLFPAGTPGSALDAIARRPLWQAGLDYDHGTGHGVGSNLAVHEGPQRIAKASGGVALQEGMILSNEPGYYKTDAYGIRIENLVIVQKKETRGDPHRQMYGFETITLAPIAKAMLKVEMLSDLEREWLNDYHQRVYDTISPLVDDPTRHWMKAACAAI